MGIAIDKGMISSVDAKVYGFFTEYKGTRWVDEQYDITIKDVLTMYAILTALPASSK